jgi:hypothetical protein
MANSGIINDISNGNPAKYTGLSNEFKNGAQNISVGT